MSSTNAAQAHLESLSFPGTSKRNLQVHDIFEEADLVASIQDLVHRNLVYKTFLESGGMFGNDLIPAALYVQGSPIPAPNSNSKTLYTYSGLVGTTLTAFNLHQNIQFRPDDLWVAILTQFSSYLNARSEELRDRFVDFEGQVDLRVQQGGSMETADFGEMTRGFLDEISQNIKDPTLKEWFLPGFSTTTVNDEIAASAIAMCAFESYFTFAFGLTCGIPQVTLLGTLQDWQQLRAKVDRLLDFDDSSNILSQEWVPMLQHILDNFILTIQEGGSDSNLRDFWDRIVLYDIDNQICAETKVLNGWLGAFSFFDSQGHRLSTAPVPPVIPEAARLTLTPTLHWPRIDLDSLFHSIAVCPATVEDNGRLYNATLLVGQMAFDYALDPSFEATGGNLPAAVDQDNTTLMRQLQSRNDWALAVFNDDDYYDFAVEDFDAFDFGSSVMERPQEGKTCPATLPAMTTTRPPEQTQDTLTASPELPMSLESSSGRGMESMDSIFFCLGLTLLMSFRMFRA